MISTRRALVASMLRIPVFSWPTKQKGAGDPTLFDVS